MTHQLTSYLRELHIGAGKPPIRHLARATGYGKTTIADALNGRVIPTWDVTKALIDALAGDEAKAKVRWIAAKGAGTTAERVPEWLISVHEPVRILPAGRGLVEACVLARDDPQAAIGDGWEAIRVSAMQLSARHYKDVPGSWSSNVVETLRRARDDGRLPPWVPEQAALLHEMYVRSLMKEPPELEAVSALAAIQYVNLAYRLGWMISETVLPHGPEHGRQDSRTAQTDPKDVRSGRTRAARLIADAVRLAQSITDEDLKAMMLADIARAVAATNPDLAARLIADAERVAQGFTDENMKDNALGSIARALAATDPDRTVRLAHSIANEYLKARALADIAGALAATDPDRAALLIADAERIAWSTSSGASRDHVFASIANVLATIDPDRAERLVHPITDAYLKIRAPADLAGALAATDPDRAVSLAQSIADDHVKACTFADVARALAANDPDRAALLIADAERLAQSSTTGEFWKDNVFADIARALAATDPDRAERYAQSITDSGLKARSLADIARALVATDPDRAARLTGDAERLATSGPLDGHVFADIARALAATDPDRAERLAKFITEEVLKIRTLVTITQV